MASPNVARDNFNELFSATHDTIINAGKPELVIFNGDPTLMSLLGAGMKVVQQGGPVLRVNIIYEDLALGKWISGFETFSVTEEDNVHTATFEWPHYRLPLVVSDDTILENSGPGQVDNLVEEKMELATRSIKNQVSQALFASSQDAKKPLSLITICATGNTVGGITQSATNDFWQANIEGTATQLTDGILRDVYLRCVFDNSAPDVMPCSRNMYQRIAAIYADKIRVMNSISTANLGSGVAKGIAFEEGKFVMDKNCPAGNVFFLNSEKLKFVVHKDCFFVKRGPLEDVEMAGIGYQFGLKCAVIPKSIRNLGRIFNATV